MVLTKCLKTELSGENREKIQVLPVDFFYWCNFVSFKWLFIKQNVFFVKNTVSSEFKIALENRPGA